MRKRHLIGVALVVSTLAVTGVAIAHTSIAETIPEDGASVEAAPESVYIRFGEPELPAPAQITDGRLEVYDACGKKVDKGDSTVNMQESSVTVSSEGAVSGRYEAHWFATAADGAEQAGVFDFEVSGGTACPSVVREDPKADVDLGVDVVKVQSKSVGRGARVKITANAPVDCASLADPDTQLLAQFDTSSDRAGDVTGRFVCKAGKIKLQMDEGVLAVSKPNTTTLSLLVPRHVLLGSVDLYIESITDKDECSDKVCAEIAPDLGLLTVF